jgi:hypothetical protein
MDDRRKEPRKKLMAFTPVYDQERGNLLGYLGDLTSQGAQVIGEKPLEIRTQATLVIQLPDDLPGVSARRMIIAARVARCVPDKESRRDFNLGFEFLGIEPEHTVIIQALLERYHFRYQS